MPTMLTQETGSFSQGRSLSSNVAWYSRKQKTVSTSTTEAEYISLASATTEVLWIQNLLEEMGMPVSYPTTIYEDCQPALAIATNTKSAALAKYIDVRHHALRDYQIKGYIDIKYLNTKRQLADGLTKVRANAREADLLLVSAYELDGNGTPMGG